MKASSFGQHCAPQRDDATFSLDVSKHEAVFFSDGVKWAIKVLLRSGAHPQLHACGNADKWLSGLEGSYLSVSHVSPWWPGKI